MALQVPESWLPWLSRGVGERLPAVGARWHEAGAVLGRLAEHVPARSTRAALERRAAGPGEDVDLHTADGLRLAGWFLPADGRAPVVVHHHFGGSRHDYLPVARMLRAAGHPVLLFDARSHGDSETGDALGLALGARPADVDAAIRHVLDRGYRSYHGLGFSMGAGIVMGGASRGPLPLSVVLDSGPVAHLFTACKGVIDQRLGDVDPELRLLAARRLYLDGMGWRYRLDIEEAARALGPTPVLIVHGDRDTVIPPAETEELRRQVLQGPCERVVLPGTEHVTGWARHRLRYQALVLDFLRGAEEAVQGHPGRTGEGGEPQ